MDREVETWVYSHLVNIHVRDVKTKRPQSCSAVRTLCVTVISLWM
jgi:hypothetical protein